MDLTIIPLPAKFEPPYIYGQPLFPCTNLQNQRWPDNSLDFGTGFDCFDVKVLPILINIYIYYCKSDIQNNNNFIKNKTQIILLKQAHTAC